MINDGVKKIEELKFWAGKNTIKIILKFSIEKFLVKKKYSIMVYPLENQQDVPKKFPS